MEGQEAHVRVEDAADAVDSQPCVVRQAQRVRNLGLIALAGVPLGWVSLVWPEQRRLRSGVRLAINGATLIVLTVLGSAGTWVTLTSSGIPAAELAEAAKWTDFGIRIGLGVAALITLGDSVREARRFIAARR